MPGLCFKRLLASLLIVLCPLIAAAELTAIVAGGDHDFPPYEFIDQQGRPSGLNIDLLRAIGRETGMEIEFRLGPWDEGREGIVTGVIDVLPMYLADFRRTDIAYATPHVIIYHEVFIRQSSPTLADLADLAGREVIVQKDAWVYESLLDRAVAADYILVETERDALLLLAQGQHDAAVVSEIVGRRTMREEGLMSLTTSGPPLFPVEYALAVRAGNDELLNRLNEGLEMIKASGEFNLLHQRWLGQPAPDQQRSSAWFWFLLASLVLVLAMALWLGWDRRRQRGLSDRAGQAEIQRFLDDSLTGLANRIGLERHLEALLRHDRLAAAEPVLLYIDLDQFKLVNESHDHGTGDELIQQAARLLEKHVGPHGFLARPGGDEFCLLLGAADLQSAEEIAESIRTQVEAHDFSIAEVQDAIHLTASIGLACFDEHIASVGEWLKRAEAACHAAKESGRNRVHVYHPEDESVLQTHDQMRWVREVGLALKEDRLELYFQTIEPARPEDPGNLTVELLLRMHMTDGSMVAAGEFVPPAEKYFIAHRIDRWVVRNSLGWLEKHLTELPNLERVFINISARSLGDDRFLPFMLEQLQQHAVPPTLIGFEVTETAMMTHLGTGLKTIGRLRAMGCAFALDDFGVGASSMAYLKQLPIDVLKIDGSFSKAAMLGERERALLREINEMGHLLGKTTVAEQVETTEARELIAALGIDRVQGWAISKPQPLARMLDLKPARKKTSQEIS